MVRDGRRSRQPLCALPDFTAAVPPLARSDRGGHGFCGRAGANPGYPYGAGGAPRNSMISGAIFLGAMTTAP